MPAEPPEPRAPEARTVRPAPGQPRNHPPPPDRRPRERCVLGRTEAGAGGAVGGPAASSAAARGVGGCGALWGGGCPRLRRCPGRVPGPAGRPAGRPGTRPSCPRGLGGSAEPEPLASAPGAAGAVVGFAGLRAWRGGNAERSALREALGGRRGFAAASGAPKRAPDTLERAWRVYLPRAPSPPLSLWRLLAGSGNSPGTQVVLAVSSCFIL